jgi:hypothetical protein
VLHCSHSIPQLVGFAMPPRVRSGKAGGSSSSTSIARATPTASAVSAQASARIGLLSGLIEGTLAIMELMVLISFSRHVCIWIYKSINGLEADQQVGETYHINLRSDDISMNFTLSCILCCFCSLLLGICSALHSPPISSY